MSIPSDHPNDIHRCWWVNPTTIMTSYQSVDEIRVFDLSSGSPKLVTTEKLESSACSQCLLDENTMLLGLKSGKIEKWVYTEKESIKKDFSLTIESSEINQISTSPDGEIAIVSSSNKGIYIVSIEQVQFSVVATVSANVVGLFLNPFKTYFVCLLESGDIGVYPNLENKNQLTLKIPSTQTLLKGCMDWSREQIVSIDKSGNVFVTQLT